MENEELAILIQQGHQEYIPQLYGQVEKLLRVMARRYFNRFYDVCARCGITEEDLIQEGYFVMMDAVKAFKQESGNKFTTYLHYPFENHVQRMTGYNGRGPRNPLDQAKSLDEPLSSENADFTLGDTIEDENSEEQFEAVETELYRSALHTAIEKSMETLEPQQREVIHCRYYENMTMQAAGDRIGCTREQARQQEQKAIRTLRKPKIAKTLRTFLFDEITSYSLRGTGIGAFRNNQSSSVERAAEHMDKIEREFFEGRLKLQEALQ